MAKTIYALASYLERKLELPTYLMYLGSLLRRSMVQSAGFALYTVYVPLNFMYIVNSHTYGAVVLICCCLSWWC